MLPSLRLLMPEFPASTVSIAVTITLTLEKLYPHLCCSLGYYHNATKYLSCHGQAYMKNVADKAILSWLCDLDTLGCLWL